MKYFFLNLLFISAFTSQAQKAQTLLPAAEEGATLSPNTKTFITNVTLIDVEKQKLIANATVGFTGSSITSVSIKSKTPLPADAAIIDGTGKFLIPGLTDAHVHFSQSGGLYTRPDAINFRKYLPFEKEIEWTHANMNDSLPRGRRLRGPHRRDPAPGVRSSPTPVVSHYDNHAPRPCRLRVRSVVCAHPRA